MPTKKVRYEAIVDFKDGQDNGKLYKAGDTYPKPVNKKVEDDRIQGLLTKENQAGKPVIKVIED